MKTAVSVPDDVFRRADEYARGVGLTRSEVYSRALREYVARHAPDAITEGLNDVVAEVGADEDRFVSESARRTLDRVEW